MGVYVANNRKFYNPYDAIMHEYMDIRHDETRRYILEQKDPVEQTQILGKLTSRLYGHITNKVTEIDFGSIPDSRGDITQIDNYNSLLDSLDTIRGLLVEYRQPTEDTVDIILEAIQNIEDRTDKFKLSFKIGNELPMMIYNTTVLAIISSTSLLISSCIEYIKIPGQEEFKISVDTVGLKRSKDNLLFNNLKKFNKLCNNGNMDNVINSVNKAGSKQLLGAIDAYMLLEISTFAIISLSIIPLMRELVYFFYYSRVKISDYFELQSHMLQMNIYELERNDTIDEEKKEKIVKRQNKVVNSFKKIANFIDISDKKSENSTYKEISKDNETKLQIDQLQSDSILF